MPERKARATGSPYGRNGSVQGRVFAAQPAVKADGCAEHQCGQQSSARGPDDRAELPPGDAGMTSARAGSLQRLMDGGFGRICFLGGYSSREIVCVSFVKRTCDTLAGPIDDRDVLQAGGAGRKNERRDQEPDQNEDP